MPNGLAAESYVRYAERGFPYPGLLKSLRVMSPTPKEENHRQLVLFCRKYTVRIENEAFVGNDEPCSCMNVIFRRSNNERII